MLLFPSAVGVLDANWKYILKSESDGKVIVEGRNDLWKLIRLSMQWQIKQGPIFMITGTRVIPRGGGGGGGGGGGYPPKPPPPPPPPPRVTLGELTIHLFPLKIQPTVYMKLWTRLGQARQLRGASYLTLAGMVTLAGETTFPHANTLSRRPVTRQLEQKMRVHAMTRMFTAIFLLSSGILSNM